MRGRFITIEGIDGAGKSTVAEYLKLFLDEQNVPVVLTREPGGTKLAEEIRQLLLLSGDESFEPMTELLLMFASRAQHIAKVVKPAIESGSWVVCERFTEATIAYQGGGRRMDRKLIGDLARIVHADFNPDISIYLDTPIEEARRRIADRLKDRFESEYDDFFDRVRDAYLALASDTDYMVLIDSTKGAEAVKEDVKELLTAWL